MILLWLAAIALAAFIFGLWPTLKISALILLVFVVFRIISPTPPTMPPQGPQMRY